jgi:hypothetical protein
MNTGLFEEVTYIVSFFGADGKVMRTCCATYDDTKEGYDQGCDFIWTCLADAPNGAKTWTARADARMDGKVNVFED